MSSVDPIERLRGLEQACERISANLVELELDTSRKLIDTSHLTGESAARWSAAGSALTELWRRLGLLQDLLSDAARLRGSRRANDLRALIEGPSIELACADVPLAERSLLDSPERSTRCSPGELIAGMSSAFDEIRSVVTGIGQAWAALVPELDEAGRLLVRCRALAEDLGESGRGDLKRAEQALPTLRASITSDPLSARRETVGELIVALNAIHADLEGTAKLQREFDANMLAARELLVRLRAAVGEVQAARRELLVKIAAPSTAPELDAPDDLEVALEQIADFARQEQWRRARLALDRWNGRAATRLERARRALEAQRAPIEARNQFRALLEAYQAKAKRLGLIEDPILEKIFARAHDTLYTAPTDLALAAQLVRRYQQALSGLPLTTETMR